MASTVERYDRYAEHIQQASLNPSGEGFLGIHQVTNRGKMLEFACEGVIGVFDSLSNIITKVVFGLFLGKLLSSQYYRNEIRNGNKSLLMSLEMVLGGGVGTIMPSMAAKVHGVILHRFLPQPSN